MKLWIIIGLALIVLGVVLVNVGTSAMSGRITLSTVAYETNTHEITEGYHDITILTEGASLRLVPATDGKTRVECYEESRAKHLVSIKDGALFIRVINEKKWYEYIGINLESPAITIYLPEGEYGALSFRGSTGDVTLPDSFSFESIDARLSTGDVTCLAPTKEGILIHTDTGDIHVKFLHAGSLDLAVTTGQISLYSVTCDGNIDLEVSTGRSFLDYVTCQSLVSEGDTGDIKLKNVIASNQIEIERTTGDVVFENCDAATLDIETDTGDVSGSLLSDKIFLVETDTGRVNVPKSTVGGRCEIETSTGNVKFEILK